ncbi:hypothetical protein FEE95_17665 [Maribacter algarum]|uniref:Uncharacterized protein n=1 Tax=Maribacter algarum (ex Zhang et al. 2020) TaxID=2578118 RepID=A0A5S3PMS7_9FLAO|nr:hypothetical protein [Maribacter algarum]TMM53726.1 hypothetical protein FEE95_17665 [Maribacter algarum]
MNKAAFVLLLITICSCNFTKEKGIAFKIKNSSDATITAVKISTSEDFESITFDSIQKNKSKEGFLSMKNNKMDGDYTLSYIRKNGSAAGISGGYYTNGRPLDSYIHFEITNDNTLVKFGEFPH